MVLGIAGKDILESLAIGYLSLNMEQDRIFGVSRPEMKLLFRCNFPTPQIIPHVKLRQLIVRVPSSPSASLRAVINLLLNTAPFLPMAECGKRIGRLAAAVGMIARTLGTFLEIQTW